MKILKQRTFRRRVDVEFPTEDGVEVQSFTAHLLALKPDQMEGRYARTDEEQMGLLCDVLIGWDGLTDDGGAVEQPFLFSVENRAELLSDVFVRRAVLAAYFAAMAGVKTGN